MELSERFRGYLPVVLDLETGGFDHQVNPILELACCFVQMQDDRLSIKGQESWNVQPVDGMVVEPASLKVTGIDLDDPHRDAMDEASVLKDFFFGAFRNEAVRLPSSDTGGSQRILRPGIFKHRLQPPKH